MIGIVGKHRTAICSFAVVGCLSIVEAWAQPSRVDGGVGLAITRSHASSDRLGDALSAAGDVDGDGFRDVLIGAPGYDIRGRDRDHCGAAILLWGQALAHREDAVLDIDDLRDQGVIFLGTRGTEAGSTVSGIGDINSDGFDDIAIGTGRSLQTSVVYGGTDFRGTISIGALPRRATTILNTGYSIAGAGDLNGDGFSDVVLGNPYSELRVGEDEGTYVGRVTVLFGGRGLPPVLDPREPGKHGFSIRGRGEAMTGEAVSGAGDVNADGLDDFLIAAPNAGHEREGRVYLVLGQHIFNMPIRFGLVAAGAGEVVSRLGDLNGDGYDDLLLVTVDFRCVLLWGREGIPERLDLRNDIPAGLGVTFDGARYGVGAGDVNGDGQEDLAFGLPYQSPGGRTGAGQIVIVFGGADWPDRINLLNPRVPSLTVDGEQAYRGFGSAIASAGDIESDGFADLIVGAPNTRMSGQGIAIDPGRVYILSGRRLTAERSEPQ